MLDFSAWLAAYQQAWITRNAEQLVHLFTEEALYQAHPLRPPLSGSRRDLRLLATGDCFTRKHRNPVGNTGDRRQPRGYRMVGYDA